MKKFKIVFATIFQDAGEATRALEIAKNIKKYKPEEFDIQIIFLSRGSRFEQKAIDLGFELYKAKPAMSGIGIYQDLKMKPGELIGEKQLAKELLSGEIEAYKELKPDLVIYGFWPVAGIARRMMEKPIPGICFIPLPLSEAFLKEPHDVPEQMKILYLLPATIRRNLIKRLPIFLKQRMPLLRHRYIRNAALKLGWHGEPLTNIICMLKADKIIVNDLPDFYHSQNYPENIYFSGPLFSQSTENGSIDAQVLEVFGRNVDKPKVFCTLGSSGTKEQLLEIVRVFTDGIGLDWNAVILSPSSVCPLQEAKALIKNRKGIYITDQFVPARKVNLFADVVICHGGQGTVQTAMASGTPIVGIATQPEQQMNLEHISAFGAGIRIPCKKWTADTIRKTVLMVLTDNNYTKRARCLMERTNSTDGGGKCAHIIWETLRSLPKTNALQSKKNKNTHR